MLSSLRIPSIPGRADHDIIIRGGTVFDGTGADGREMDVAITGDRIAEVAQRATARGREEIDARGMAVAPGFIDIHSHGDGNMEEDPRVESVIRQGVTTMVVGVDGSSRATGASEKSFASLFASIDALRPGPNVASMVGYGSIRETVIGDMDRPATADEIARMGASISAGATSDYTIFGASALTQFNDPVLDLIA